MMNFMMKETTPVFTNIFCVHSKSDGLTENDFRKCFSKYGTIALIKTKTTRKETLVSLCKDPIGYTYIHFQKTSEACLAIEEMDNKVIKPNTKTIRVYLAFKKDDNLKIDVDRSMMLERICVKHGIEENESIVEGYFSQFGIITHVYQPKKRASNGQWVRTGSSFIRFTKQSDAARALEECHRRYMPTWADVKLLGPPAVHKTDVMHGKFRGRSIPINIPLTANSMSSNHPSSPNNMSLYGHHDNLLRHDSPSSMPLYSAPNDILATPLYKPHNSDLYGNDVSPSTFKLEEQKYKYELAPKVIEAVVPLNFNAQDIHQLFDIAPGLVHCDYDPEIGFARIEYAQGSQAAWAKNKIDKLSIFGHPIVISFATNASNNTYRHILEEKALILEEQLRQLRSEGCVDYDRMNCLVTSLQEVTSELLKITDKVGIGTRTASAWPQLSLMGPLSPAPSRASLGSATQTSMHEDRNGALEGGWTLESWCNVALPPPRPLLPANCTTRGKVFIISNPAPAPEEMLKDAFCRFGTLISCEYEKGKCFAFAKFGDKENARKSIDTLNQCTLMFEGKHTRVQAYMAKHEEETNSSDDTIPKKKARQI